MKKTVSLLFIIFVMFHVAWGKPGNETKLEKLRFTFLTADSSSCASLYKFFKKKELSNKRHSVIITSIQCSLEAIKHLQLSSGINSDSKESGICCSIKSNNNILVKLIMTSPDLAKNRMLLRTLIYLLELPISTQDKELVQKFMKKYYSVKQISAEKKSIMFMYNIVRDSSPINFEDFFFIASSYLSEYDMHLRVFLLFQNSKISQIKCLLRNHIVYNHILISLILQHNPMYIKEEGYVSYQKDKIIQKIVSDYENKKNEH